MSVEYRLPVSAPLSSVRYNIGLESGFVPSRLGLLANGFPDAEKFLQKQADALAKFWPDATFRIAKKANADQLNIGIQEPLLSDLANDCDAIIIAWGHCGSCTSGVARDAIAFAEKGVPSVMLICDAFWDYSEWIGTALGMTNLAKVKLPFPIAGTGEQNQLACAERIARDIIGGLSIH